MRGGREEKWKREEKKKEKRRETNFKRKRKFSLTPFRSIALISASGSGVDDTSLGWG